MKIIIISGGSSSERKISLISAKEVKKALQKNGHFVKLFDLKLGVEPLKKLIPGFDVAFPVIHGEEGEGGELQGFLSRQKIPYVGGDPKGFKKAWPKISFKKYCDKNKIITSEWKIVKSEKDILNFGFPCVLKASNGGSSREVVMLKSIKDLKKKPASGLLRSNVELFAEEYIKGIEVTAGILGNKVLPLIEIIPPVGKWFDYKNKYTGVTQEVPFAPSLSKTTQERIQKIALKIHQHFDLGPYSRTDFIISKSASHLRGAKLNPYVLEVNTIPGLTPESLFPKGAKAIGLSFDELIEKLINLALVNLKNP